MSAIAKLGLPVLVLMGVSGSGKSTVGALLAERLGGIFEDGDDLHPSANIAKLRAGEPLDDDDRAPWLDAVAGWIAAHAHDDVPAIIACSALKRSYRERLRRESGVTPFFVLLDVDAATLRDRVAHRPGHFMPATLLDSQRATLEPLAPDEHGLTIDATAPPDAIATRLLAALRGSERATNSLA